MPGAEGMGDGRFHVALVLDGNGRWAEERGRRRREGHEAGAEAARALVRAAPAREIDVLTLHAFPAALRRRPAGEVATLLGLLERYLEEETPVLREMGVTLRLLGRRDRLPPAVLAAAERAEALTWGGDVMTLRLAVDYSSRHALAGATRRLVQGSAAPGPALRVPAGPGRPHPGGAGEPAIDADGFAQAVAASSHGPPVDVDLLIRTGGERRLDDFLLWECAYAELVFSDVLWPDFDEGALDAALREYVSRDRRFGRVAATR